MSTNLTTGSCSHESVVKLILVLLWAAGNAKYQLIVSDEKWPSVSKIVWNVISLTDSHENRFAEQNNLIIATDRGKLQKSNFTRDEHKRIAAV